MFYTKVLWYFILFIMYSHLLKYQIFYFNLILYVKILVNIYLWKKRCRHFYTISTNQNTRSIQWRDDQWFMWFAYRISCLAYALFPILLQWLWGSPMRGFNSLSNSLFNYKKIFTLRMKEFSIWMKNHSNFVIRQSFHFLNEILFLLKI